MKLVSVETPEKSVCKMTFSASAEELEAASNAVYERTRATYTIKGFAKGEADRAQIEADRGEHTFWYDAITPLKEKSKTSHSNSPLEYSSTLFFTNEPLLPVFMTTMLHLDDISCKASSGPLPV